MPLQEGYSTLHDGRWYLVATHELQGVTATMLDWWWRNINTARYRLWHPGDHISFTWDVPPANDTLIGAVQRIEEYFDAFPPLPAPPLQLKVTYLDPRIPELYQGLQPQYTHILLARGEGVVPATLMHEYQDFPDGVLRMRSHFLLGSQAPEKIVAALFRHNQQEMQHLNEFLPDLYAQEAQHKCPLHV